MEFHITYDNYYWYYVVHTDNGEFEFNKYEMVLPYIIAENPQYVNFVQTVLENVVGITKK